MKCMIAFILAVLIAGSATVSSTDQVVFRDQIVEASCGQCIFGVDRPGCDLAVRLDGRVYRVEGAGIDDFGDAHAADGFCNSIRSARVSGFVVDETFHATEIEMLPVNPG